MDAAWGVIALALIGLYISVYFTLLAARLVSPAGPWVPYFCRLGDEACDTVVHTPAGRLLGGVPNSVYGIAYYAAILYAAASGALNRPSVAFGFAFVAGITILLGVYLTYQLSAVLKVRCPLCLAVHIVNFILGVVFAAFAAAP